MVIATFVGLSSCKKDDKGDPEYCGTAWANDVQDELAVVMSAASEEVVRVFLLNRLWKVWPSITGKLIVVVISACLFGLIHFYQGPLSTSWTVIFGLIMAFYYLRFGRVVPLIIAHYLTNALQMVVFAIQFTST